MTKVTKLLPQNAPFSETQYSWLSGYLQGLKYYAQASATDQNTGQSDVTVLYSSQTGNAENVAHDIATLLHTQALDIGDMDKDSFMALKYLVLVSSTYGDGEHPDSAQPLWNALQGVTGLDTMEFSVLGLGDTAYDMFCQTATDWEQLLLSAGAKKALDTAKLDVDYEDHIPQWNDCVVAEFGKYAQSGQDSAQGTTNPTPHKSQYTKSNPFMGKIVAKQLLSGQNSTKQVFHMEFSVNDTDMQYKTGDALGIIPVNSDTLVQHVLRAGGWTGQEIVHDTPLHEWLKYKKEIRLPTKDIIGKICGQDCDTTDIHECSQALENAQNAISPSDFVDMLKPLQHRLYSISSSPKNDTMRIANTQSSKDSDSATPDDKTVHITFSAVRYDYNDKNCQGVASCYLADAIEIGDQVGIFMHANKNFAVPDDDSVPMIMVGPGTGIAPFRGFIQERLARKATGLNWLFFGDRTKDDDFLYQDELTQWQDSGHLKLSCVWSRQHGMEKAYVQDAMQKNGADIFQALEQGGYFYICGDASRMAKDVEATLLDIIATQGGFSTSESTGYLDTLKQQKRYCKDVY